MPTPEPKVIDASAFHRTNRREDGVKVLADIEFARPGGFSLKLDLHMPTRAAGPLPTVLHFHGGGWHEGSRQWAPLQVFDVVRAGYAVASADYRHSQDGAFPAPIQDCKAAVRYLRANAGKLGLDGGRLAAWGNSSGAHLAALLGTSGSHRVWDVGENLDVSSEVQAVIVWHPPVDFLAIQSQLPPGSTRGHDAPGSNISRMLGAPAKERPEQARAASPLTHVGPHAPPTLILHGDADDLVPLAQGRMLHEALSAAGAESQLCILHGARHAGAEWDAVEIGRIMIEFLDCHLR